MNAREALIQELYALNDVLQKTRRGSRYLQVLAERDKVQAELTALIQSERISDREFLEILALELNELNPVDGPAALDYLANLREDLEAHLEARSADEEDHREASTDAEIMAEVGALRTEVKQGGHKWNVK